jgi:pimeloyl-ACP methyl ester carboxylesterase
MLRLIILTTPWFGRLAALRNSADGTWFLPYTASIDFDPVPVYESIDVPVLAILGEADPLVPARETAAILERVKVEKNKDITVAILAGADHNVNRPTGPRPVPEYAETMIGWVREKLAAPVPGARSWNSRRGAGDAWR